MEKNHLIAMNKEIVVFIDSLRGDGGVENVCVTIVNSFFENQWHLTLLSLDPRGGENIKEKINPAVKCEILNKKHVRTSIFAVWHWLLLHRPKKILVFSSQLAVLLVILRSLLRMHFRIISRNMNTLSQKNKKEKSFWHKFITHNIVIALYKNVDLIIAQSQVMKEDLLENYEIQESKITVINNPIQKKIENYLLNDEPMKKISDDYIMCAGRLQPQKAFHYAIEAFARIATDYPALRLKILGQGNLERELKQQAYDFNVSNKVDFEGYCRDIIPYYVNARLTLLTSLYEGMPNVLIESIALGTPIVSFDCLSGPNEIIQDGINGYLVRYQDTEHLTECIRRALDRQWDSQAVKATANKFSSAKIIAEYEKALL